MPLSKYREEKEKASRRSTILFVVKTLQDGEVNPPSDYGRSLTGVLHSRAVEKYQEREDSIQSGMYYTSQKELLSLGWQWHKRKEKSENLHFLSFSDESRSRKWEKIALFFSLLLEDAFFLTKR